MRKHSVEKQERIDKLLEALKTTPMNRIDIQHCLGLSKQAADHYITLLRFNKQIHIHKYMAHDRGTPYVYYMEGNKPNAPRPPKKTVKQHNDEQRAKRAGREKEIREIKNMKFVPHMDIAAAWLRNPIC